ncbi:hypothetical protein KUM39_04930 [Streptomyces sp. J2-1]|uniref:hypothetical protein n=1 Tax=Streptomyces corallincola TaxID=2851888 RepID=UPI001C392B06|nr:hypothetical protein [Streptomyces corallincola]MBV2353711.1 hypothetical protein [Streptomyces corallincola]
MVERQQQSGTDRDRPEGAGRRRGGEIAAFGIGVLVTLAYFGFFPGLPHVIDGGAIVVAVVAGLVARWGWRAWAGGRKPGG